MFGKAVQGSGWIDFNVPGKDLHGNNIFIKKLILKKLI